MWKLFQSVLKSFRTQAVVPPCNRIAATPDQSPSLNSGTGNEDDEINEICGNGQKLPPPVEAPLRRCDSFVTFPQIEPPSPVKNCFDLSNDKKSPKNVKFNLPFKPVEIGPTKAPFLSPPLLSIPPAPVRIDAPKPTMASMHNAMGLASLKALDNETALQHFLIAADAFGSPRANYNLGVLYEFHLNNISEAARRYRLAGSHPDALYNLAYLTLHSPDALLLMPKSAREEEALVLLKKAAKHGSKEAAKFLDLFNNHSNRAAESSTPLEKAELPEPTVTAAPSTATGLMPA